MSTIYRQIRLALVCTTLACMPIHNGYAEQPAESEAVKALRAEIKNLEADYRKRIANLESKLEQLEAGSPQSKVASNPVNASMPPSSQVSSRLSSQGVSAVSANRTGSPAASAAAFNPAIGIILNGRYSGYTAGDSSLSGLAVGEEGERKSEGLLLDESEINASANIDDKFAGSITAALASEEGEDVVEIEEAYVQTKPGLGLPTGLTSKFGRALWNFGYINEHHTHSDDFADRPLPYRAFLNNAFNDDGIQFSYVLPTDLFAEVGGGAFRGDAYPFGGSRGDGVNAWSGYVRFGGDIGDNQSWRIGGSYLGGSVGERSAAEDTVNYNGDTQLYAADLRYTWAPTGNGQERELTLQAEYLWRNEDGAYRDSAANADAVAYNEVAQGFYAQAVYKFLRPWRVGVRYSLLAAPEVPTGLEGSPLDAQGNDPEAWALMLDWTNSEFSRLRFQYNYEELSEGENDNQFILQYIMSLGAHGAHAY